MKLIIAEKPSLGRNIAVERDAVHIDDSGGEFGGDEGSGDGVEHRRSPFCFR